MIYGKTALGQRAFQQRDVRLSARARSVLIMIDGKRDIDALKAMLAAIGAGEEQLIELVQAGFIEVLTSAPSLAKVSAGAAGIESEYANLDDIARYKLAYPLATQLTAGLGLKGFRLNLSVESAGNLQDLIVLAPKIREAVGKEKFAELGVVLGL